MARRSEAGAAGLTTPFHFVTIPFRVALSLIAADSRSLVAATGFGARMAFLRKLGGGKESDGGYDPYRLSSPQVFLLSMLVFLAIVAFIAAILARQISSAFTTNPGLNGLILGVLAVGILLAFVQVLRLFREIRWVNSFRAGSEVV